MASRATSYWRTLLSRMGGGRGISTVGPKMRSFAAAMDAPHLKQRQIKGEFVPMYVALGLITLSTTVGLYTAQHELLYGPQVYVSKKKRESFPEVVDPDYVVDETDKFITTSLFRKVAHIQDPKKTRAIPDPTGGDAFHRPRHVETLKTVGVDPKIL